MIWDVKSCLECRHPRPHNITWLTFLGVTVHRILMMLLDFSCPSWGFFLRNSRLLHERQDNFVLQHTQPALCAFPIHSTFKLPWRADLIDTLCYNVVLHFTASVFFFQVIRRGNEFKLTKDFENIHQRDFQRHFVMCLKPSLVSLFLVWRVAAVWMIRTISPCIFDNRHIRSKISIQCPSLFYTTLIFHH